MISGSHHNIIGMKFLGWDWDRDRKKQNPAFLPREKKRKYECVKLSTQLTNPPWSTGPGDRSYPRSPSPNIQAQTE